MTMRHDIHGALTRLKARRGATLIAPGFNRPAATRRHEAMGAALVASACKGIMRRAGTTDPATGKLAFIWGVDGFTADELANDRWVMT